MIKTNLVRKIIGHKEVTRFKDSVYVAKKGYFKTKYLYYVTLAVRCEYGSICGALPEANDKYLEERFPSIFGTSISLHFAKGSQFSVRDLFAESEENLESLLWCLNYLSRYPVLDEDLLAAIEMEEKGEYFERDIASNLPPFVDKENLGINHPELWESIFDKIEYSGDSPYLDSDGIDIIVEYFSNLICDKESWVYPLLGPLRDLCIKFENNPEEFINNETNCSVEEIKDWLEENNISPFEDVLKEREQNLIQCFQGNKG